MTAQNLTEQDIIIDGYRISKTKTIRNTSDKLFEATNTNDNKKYAARKADESKI